MKLRLVSTVFFVGVASIACSSSSSSSLGGTNPGQTAPTTQTIGAAGGTVTATGVVLTIPPGALSSDTTILITPNAAALPAGFAGHSPLYEFQPTGTKFATPATIAFTTSSAGTSPTVYWSNDTGTYDALDTAVTATGVSAPIQHFSTGFAANRFNDVVVDAGNGADDAGSGPIDAGPPGVGSFSVTVDGVVTSFAANAKVTLGMGTTTITGDDDPSTTHWTITLVTNGQANEACVANGNPDLNYEHYTAGVEDKLYLSKSVGGACTIELSSNPVNPGDLATGGFSATVGKGNAPVSDPATHAFTAATFNLTL